MKTNTSDFNGHLLGTSTWPSSVTACHPNQTAQTTFKRLYRFFTVPLKHAERHYLRRPFQSLANSLGDTTGSTFELPVTLSVSSTGTESKTNPGGKSAALEQKDREDDTESGTEGRLHQEIRKAVVPLVVPN